MKVTWTRGSVGWACFAHLSFCFEETSIGASHQVSVHLAKQFQRRRFLEINQPIHVNLPAGAFLSRFWGSLPSLPTFKIFHPWKKSSTIKSWPTFCNQYFWKFPIWNSRADEKRREIRMVKVNVIFNDIRLLICLTPLQVNWVVVIN